MGSMGVEVTDLTPPVKVLCQLALATNLSTLPPFETFYIFSLFVALISLITTTYM